MKITSAEFVISNTKLDLCPKPDKAEYAFIGRSNVGKSSLINYIVNNKNLAKTSGRPGKTQLINHFIINEEWYLVDLPGYGYAQTSKKNRAKWEQFISDYILQRENFGRDLASYKYALDYLLLERVTELFFFNDSVFWTGNSVFDFLESARHQDCEVTALTSSDQHSYHLQSYALHFKGDIAELSKEERIQELAKMLSGSKITDAAITNAKELLA